MTIRVGLIGCGAIAQASHLPGFQRNGIAVAGIADPRPGIAAELRERGLPVPALHPDHHALLAAGPLDAVAICTPNCLHARQFLDCVGRVGAIILEKPVAISLDECAAMRLAAAAAGTRVMVGFSHRFNPLVRALRQALVAGRIGEPYHIRIRFAHGGPIPGWARTGWFHDPAQAGGGALLDMGIHAFDLVRWLVGEPTAVSARVATLRKDIQVDDNAVALLEIGRRCLATVEVGWTSPAGACGIEVMGDAGALVADYNAQAAWIAAGGRNPDGTSRERREDLAGGPADAWSCQAAYAAETLRSGGAFSPDLEDGIAALRIALAAAGSSRQGRRLAIG